MSETERRYKEALKFMVIHGDIYFNYEDTITLYIYERLFWGPRTTFHDADCYKTLENLKKNIKDFYITEYYSYGKSDGQVHVTQEYLKFYTIEYPVILTLEISKNEKGEVFNNECSKLNIIYVPYETPSSRESRISNLKIIIKYEEEKLLRLKKELEQLEMGSD